ncbi:glycerate kinase type-2 family protein [Haloprofundus halobius]|uniref:glycerate kinase type-2 family protein n=1 Tax=Haloprofundus halobius TaxID=2876194 RepID=UPI001CCC9201|nr:glycerate kinase [Haloprofundus halobius]
MTLVRNAADLGGSEARETALACLDAGIDAANPERAVADAVTLDGQSLKIADDSYDLREFDDVFVLGGGKAGVGVARALENRLGDRLTEGVVVVPDPAELSRVEVAVGDHPVPSERGVEGTRRLLDLAEAADDRTLVLAVVTGGGSALLAAPAEGVSLEDLKETTDALLDSGAEIHEMNAVRKHLSAIKGGRLARAAAPATVVGLVLSDVVGDDLSVIASGPTAPDETTYADALDVLERYDIDAPEAVRTRLERGAAAELDETPRPDDPVFDRVRNVVLAGNFTSLDAARNEAEARGYDACILSSRVRGESREAAKTHVAVAEEANFTGNPVSPPAVVLSGGETTVTVRGDGTGGPNQEFALSAAIEFATAWRASREVVLGSVDTDGRDGGTDVAGAVVDAGTVDDVAAARDALADNDAFTYLDARDAIVETGPTGTNVNDLRVLVVGDGE